jgi:hypothetical protein
MNILNVIERARRFCKRNITATQKGGVLTRMVKMTGHKYDFSVDASVPTACWRFDHASDKHIIRCGTRLGDLCKLDVKHDEKKMKKFVEGVIRHETEHGILSDRSNDVFEACQANKIPFRIWNLFEDARIEYLSATRKDGDGAFRWTNFQEIKEAYNVAISLFFAIRTNEAGIKKQPSAYVPKWLGADSMLYQGKQKKTRLIVLDFYRRAIACETSMDLIPILIEWIKIFGNEVPEVGDDSINGKDDPNLDKDKSKQDDNLKDIIGDDQMPSQERNDWRHRNRAFNEDQISRIARAMNAVIENAKVMKNKLSVFGNRIHPQQAMQGSEKSFLNRGRTQGKRSVTLIVDASGSMDKTWCNYGGKEFVLAFRKLARDGKIDLDILLTTVKHGKAQSRRITTETDQWINNLRVDGNAEGVMQVIRRFLPVIKRSTTSVIFTDSKLRMRDIDTQGYRNMGLDMIATYIEPDASELDEGRERMNRHFARSVIAQDATELARRLMREVLKD